MRVLVFGDSITQGFWDTDGGWVERLRKHYDLLQVQDLHSRDEPKFFNLGISGDNSGAVLGRVAAETKARTWLDDLPVVVVNIGLNDSSTDSLPDRESVRVPVEQYEQNLREIIEQVKPLSSKIIFVGLTACDEAQTTPVFWVNVNYSNANIKKYEDKMKSVAAEHNIPFIPIFDRFLAELKGAKAYLSDGLHPNNAGHNFLYEVIQTELSPFLAE